MISDSLDLMVNISDLNQYLYCPRRLYYLMFYQTQGMNAYLADGKERHKRQSRRGGWIREMYLSSTRLGLHGKIDLLDQTRGMIPVERKRGERYYLNDEVQIAAYAMLLEEYMEEPVNHGVIYLYETRQRHDIAVTEELRKRVHETISAIRDMSPEKIPPFEQNRNKCHGCSVLLYCLPDESELLEGI